MTDLSASASFERGIEPSAKRARFEPTDIAPEPVAEVAVGGDGQSGEDEVHITVPQTQFEIEINSGSVDDEDDDMVRETILQQDLNGPAFAITTASQVCRQSCVHVGHQHEASRLLSFLYLASNSRTFIRSVLCLREPVTMQLERQMAGHSMR